MKHKYLPLSDFQMYKQLYKTTSKIVTPFAQGQPEITGVESFDTPAALEINRARMEHLDKLDLKIDGKSVLDVGCGVGHLAQFFVKKGCNVFCTDGRSENIISLKKRYPGLKADVADVEKDALSRFGVFAIVLCYGLLYHLENPAVALHNINTVCKELLLLETIITDHQRPLLQLVYEPGVNNQSLSWVAGRPSPSYVVMTLLHTGFPYVYVSRFGPDHRDFRFKWKGDMAHWRDGHPLRQIFIASRSKLEHEELILVGEKIETT
jgi:SAM-dependent methyltransferase